MVLLILAILLAVAIPTFLAVTKSANDRSAQSNLNTALVNAQLAYEQQGQSYTDSSVTNSTQFAAAMQIAVPSLTFETIGSASQADISVWVSTDGNGIVLAALSESTNNCWYIIENPEAPRRPPQMPPWGTAVISTNGVTRFGSANPIVFSAQQGTIYAEVKGSKAIWCRAKAPISLGGVTTGGYQWSTSGFPTI